MAAGSDNVFPKVILAEGAAPATPSANQVKAYAKADGLLYSKDDAGVETLMSSGAVSGIPATILDVKGDLIAATAADTVARLAAAANGAALITASGESTGLKWRLNNDGAVVAPAVTDDSGDGYSIGSRWLDTTADKEYVALDVSVGAAVWKETTVSSGYATVNFIIDGGGSAITTGVKGDVILDFAGVIESVTVLLDQSGSIVVDIWEDVYANYPPVDADSMTAAAPPTVSAATKSQDATLTGWTTAVVAGSVLRFNCDSVMTAQRATVSLKIRKT